MKNSWPHSGIPQKFQALFFNFFLAPSCFDESNQAECGDLGAKLVVRIQVMVVGRNVTPIALTQVYNLKGIVAKLAPLNIQIQPRTPDLKSGQAPKEEHW
jgi:hypothetical protein